MNTWDSTWANLAEGFARIGHGTDDSNLVATGVFTVLAKILGQSTRRMLGRQESEWEDALQTVFLYMVEYRDKAPTEGTIFRKWVCVIRRGVCCNLIRGQRPQEALPQDDPVAPGAGVATRIHFRSENDRLLQRMERLPSPLSEVARFRLVDGLPTEEIARRLDVNTRLIRRHLVRAMEYLSE